MRAVRTANWKYIRNLDPQAQHHTHVDLGKASTDGRAYWDSWVVKAKTDPAAAAIVRRYHTRPAEELYDLKQDPWERNNLAEDPAQKEVLGSLRTHLDAWMKANGDNGLKTERSLPDPRVKAR